MIGERLCELRKDANMTQDDLAAILNINKYSISSYERDKSEPPDVIKIAIAKYFDGSAEYANFADIESKLKSLLSRYKRFDWENADDIGKTVSEFLLELWSIHPFREGNTRTCITFLWHYLNARKVCFQVELLRNNPMYVQDSLVMANYGVTQYLTTIISDALSGSIQVPKASDLATGSEEAKEQYQISKAEYELFKEKYKICQLFKSIHPD